MTLQEASIRKSDDVYGAHLLRGAPKKAAALCVWQEGSKAPQGPAVR